MADHTYALDVEWTGNRGSGTTGYRDYDREHTVSTPGKPTLHGSADPAFRGVQEAWNPEVMPAPQVTVAETSMVAVAEGLHAQAHDLCFIARSVNFAVGHRGAVTAEDDAQ